MIKLAPEDAKTRFGPLLSQKFLAMADECLGRAEIVEQCRACGTIERDAMNLRREGGAMTAAVLLKEQRW